MYSRVGQTLYMEAWCLMMKLALITLQSFRIWCWAENFCQRNLVWFRQSDGSLIPLAILKLMPICFPRWDWTQSCFHVGVHRNQSRGRKINRCNSFGRLTKVQKSLHTIFFKEVTVFHSYLTIQGKYLQVNTREFKNILMIQTLHLWN